MTKNEMLFEMMKVVAPVIVQEGINLQNRVANTGKDPANCTINGKSIPDAYAETARIWAESMVNEFVDYDQNH
ncbi:MAG: hypothetical protein IKO36_11615 [Bacteroidaceae bacterium]|nr:hypothetical protein [Bacteroidaceae bacterium]